MRKPVSSITHIGTSDNTDVVDKKSQSMQKRIENKLIFNKFNRHDTERDLEYSKSKNRLMIGTISALLGTGLLILNYYRKNPDGNKIKISQIIGYISLITSGFSTIDAFYELYKCNNYEEHLHMKEIFYK